jgi:hypothetical protein
VVPHALPSMPHPPAAGAGSRSSCTPRSRRSRPPCRRRPCPACRCPRAAVMGEAWLGRCCVCWAVRRPASRMPWPRLCWTAAS